MDQKRVESNSDAGPTPLSVVVVTVYNSVHLERCLASLECQINPPKMEIIVVCDERIHELDTLKKQFSLVRFHVVPGRRTQEELRAAGVTQARGTIVALTVDHCAVEAHWCERIMEKHVGPYAAVGGAVEKGEPVDTALNWAIHIYDYGNYGYFLNPVKRGPARALSDFNISYKREFLTARTELWQESFHVSFVNQSLSASGETLWISPDLVVYQYRSINVGKATQVAYRRGRVFAAIRIAESAAFRRLFYACFALLLPSWLLGRLMANLLGKRSYWKPMLRAFPFIVLLATVWSLGEFVSYFTGSAKRYRDMD